MEPLHLETVADRVVAWHNRHPLALRIAAAQVRSVGYVALPFAAAAAPAPTPAAAQAETGGGPAATPAAEVAPDGSPGAAPEAVSEAAPGSEPPAPAVSVGASTPASAGLHPAFDEDFIAPLKPARIGRWAAGQGLCLDGVPAGAPLRQVLSREPATVPLTQVYLLTAAVEVGSRRVRLLLGAGSPPALLGPRLLDRRRVVGAAIAGLALPVLAFLALWLPGRLDAGRAQTLAAARAPQAPATARPASAARTPQPRQATAASQAGSAAEPGIPASAATLAQRASAQASQASAPDAEDRPEASADMAAPAASAAAVAEAASEAASVATAAPLARWSGAPAPGLVRRLVPGTESLISDADKAAARQARAALVASGALTPAPPAAPAVASAPGEVSPAGAHASADLAAAASVPLPRVATTPQAPQARQVPQNTQATQVAQVAQVAQPTQATQAASVAPGAPAFALSTRRLRTRAEAEQVQAAMAALLGPSAVRGLHTEILPQGDDWRVASWPFVRSRDAEQARTMLAARGMRVEVVAF